jgi:hypothetical protein
VLVVWTQKANEGTLVQVVSKMEKATGWPLKEIKKEMQVEGQGKGRNAARIWPW